MTTPAAVVLDTSVIIDLDELELGDMAHVSTVVTAVTLAELAYGLGLGDVAQRAARTERFYSVLHTHEILPFDTAAAKVYGVLAAVVRQSGRDPRPRRMDLQIAATAGAHGMPLVTRNPVDFAGLERYVEIVGV